MAITCPECGQGNPDDSNYCVYCGAPLGAEKRAKERERLKLERMRAREERKARGGEHWFETPVFIMGFYLGAFILIMIPFWGALTLFLGLIFLGIAIAASLRKKTVEEGKEAYGAQRYVVMGGAVIGAIITRGYLSAFVPMWGMDLLVGFAITVISVCFMNLITPFLDERPTEKLWVGIFGFIILITALVLTEVIKYIFIGALIICGYLASWTIGYPNDVLPGGKYAKLLPGLGALGLMIFVGLAYAMIMGGTMIGGTIDQVMHSLQGGASSGGTGSIFDMILNPKLALQAQLKPPTQREVTTTAAPPNIAYVTQFEAIPKTGCYNHSTYTIIGKIKNTGNVFIDDITLEIKKEEGASNPAICQQDAVKTYVPGTSDPCKWKNIKIAPGSTVSKSCMVSPIPGPTSENIEFWGQIPCWPNCDFAYTGGSGSDVLPSHRCYFDVVATTAFQARSILPIEIIQADYARDKYMQGTLAGGVRPSITSVGPIEISLGGFEQPVWVEKDEGADVTLIASIVNTGNGEVDRFYSAYLLIPTNLLEDTSCKSSDWTCMEYKGADADYDCAEETCASSLKGLKKFKDNKVGNFTLNFDKSLNDEELKNNYAICFYNGNLSTKYLIQTATCNLHIPYEESLRWTAIIRGDILYTYKVTQDASFEVRDCVI